MDNWDTLLPIATMAYNTVRQDTVGESPFYLMYGTNPRDSFSNWLNVEDEDETLEERLKKLDTTRRTAHDHVTKNQLKQKTQYDKHRRTTQFEDGDVVLLMNYKIIEGSSQKLFPTFEGYYEIVTHDGDKYRIKKLKANTRQRLIVDCHVSQLRRAPKIDLTEIPPFAEINYDRSLHAGQKPKAPKNA